MEKDGLLFQVVDFSELEKILEVCQRALQRKLIRLYFFLIYLPEILTDMQIPNCQVSYIPS